MALKATVSFEDGCTVLSYDEASAFSIYHQKFLPALSGNRPLSGPLRIKPERTGTPQTPACIIRLRRFGSD